MNVVGSLLYVLISKNQLMNDAVDDDYSNLLDSELGLGEGKIVTGLSLYGQNLRGKIPKEIEILEFLHVLDLGVSC